MFRDFKIAPHLNPLPMWGEGRGEGDNSKRKGVKKYGSRESDRFFQFG